MDKDLKFELSFTGQCENLHSQQVPAAREAVSFACTKLDHNKQILQACQANSYLICIKEAHSQSCGHVNHTLLLCHHGVIHLQKFCKWLFLSRDTSQSFALLGGVVSPNLRNFSRVRSFTISALHRRLKKGEEKASS